jgi:hypothetical protein
VTLHRGNLFLVGLMGAGKSTLGRQLARRLQKRFVDADHELEERLGVTIPTIFEIEGEVGFRDREEAIIDDLTRLTDVVLATGGGAVLRPASRERLKAGGLIYLPRIRRRSGIAWAAAVTARCSGRRSASAAVRPVRAARCLVSRSRRSRRHVGRESVVHFVCALEADAPQG